MKTILLDDFLDDGIIREKSFRKMVKEHDMKQYDGEKVIIKGCASVTVPTWAYLIIATELTKHAKSIYFGESCSAIKIFQI